MNETIVPTTTTTVTATNTYENGDTAYNVLGRPLKILQNFYLRHLSSQHKLKTGF